MATHIRLLRLQANGDFDFESFAKGCEPPYAILSHTWSSGKDAEVLYDDIVQGKGRLKDGYEKINFCIRQAKVDGLFYVWIDTCCIDKRNLVELQAAINSMFRWYKGATRCYVYLSDVSVRSTNDYTAQPAWASALGKSRWFTRGWTLQELLAPSIVEFFSREGERLGDRLSLQEAIHDITGIPVAALEGSALNDFSIDQRLSWVKKRSTSEEEDIAYCLLGIFGITMLVNYGEGKAEANKRLLVQIYDQDSTRVRGSNKFHIPFSLEGLPLNEYFVDRPSNLREMEDSLLPSREQRQEQQQVAKQRRHIHVLRGSGGIGKTQLACQFARHHQDDYSAVFWIDGQSEIAMQQSMARQAARVPHGQISEASRQFASGAQGNIVAVVHEVLEWLEQEDNTRWLLIIDNVDRDYLSGHVDPQAYDLMKYIPRSDHGAILVTTRLARLEELGRSQLLDKVDIAVAKSMLAQRYELSLEDDKDVNDLLGKLDGLPLAIVQAGSYLRQSGIDLKRYLGFYTEQWDRLHGSQAVNSQPIEGYQNRELWTTWTISYLAVQAENHFAAKLLFLWSLLGNKDMWFGLFDGIRQNPKFVEPLVAAIGEVTTDEMAFTRAMMLLRQYSLIEESERAGTYSTHPVIHKWVYHYQGEQTRRQLAPLAACVIGMSAPQDFAQSFHFSHGRRLLPHAEACCQLLFARVNDDHWIRAVLSDRHQVTKERQQNTLYALYFVGALYLHLGNLVEAEQLVLATLQCAEELLGTTNVVTILLLHQLGHVYDSQHKYHSAEKIYSRALKGFESTPGSESKMNETLVDLSGVYRRQNRFDIAEHVLERAFAGFQRIYGSTNVHTIDAAVSLGMVYILQAKRVQAEETLLQALSAAEQMLGLVHVTTLVTLQSLGNLYFNQWALDKCEARMRQAEQMYLRVIEGFEQVLNPNSPTANYAANSLGRLYFERYLLLQKEDDLDQSERMTTRALQGHVETMAPETYTTHTDVLEGMETMGDIYAARRKPELAREWYAKALAGNKRLEDERNSKAIRRLTNILEGLKKLENYDSETSNSSGEKERVQRESRTKSMGKNIRKLLRRLAL